MTATDAHRASGNPLRVAIIASILAQHDAISDAVLHSARCFGEIPDSEVVILCGSGGGHSALPAHVVPRVADLILHPAFRHADVIIYHFGIYHELFDAALIGNGRALQGMVFHNVTPPDLVPAPMRWLAEKSMRQLHNFRSMDWFEADSTVNRDVLIDFGIDTSRIQVVPLPVDWPPPGSLAQKPRDRLNLLFVGRIVPSKGVLDLIHAVDRLKSSGFPEFRLRIAGNLEFSAPDYVARVRQEIAARNLSDTVAFLGTVAADQLAALYAESHLLVIPSYHEGFCKPVIEALRAGCVPVGYRAANLAHIAGPLGRMVPPGDIAALAAAIQAIGAALEGNARGLLELDGGPLTVADFDAAAREYVSGFEYEAVARRRRAWLMDRLAPRRLGFTQDERKENACVSTACRKPKASAT